MQQRESLHRIPKIIIFIEMIVSQWGKSHFPRTRPFQTMQGRLLLYGLLARLAHHLACDGGKIPLCHPQIHCPHTKQSRSCSTWHRKNNTPMLCKGRPSLLEPNVLLILDFSMPRSALLERSRTETNRNTYKKMLFRPCRTCSGNTICIQATTMLSKSHRLSL